MNQNQVNSSTDNKLPDLGNQNNNPPSIPVGQNTQYSNPTKEREPIKNVSGEPLVTQTDKEIELPGEIKKAGVIKREESIEIPPDLQQVGLQVTGMAVPVPQTPSLNLPIPDETIIKGLRVDILMSLRWLAVWCLMKLKKAHMTLKVIHGKVRRIKLQN